MTPREARKYLQISEEDFDRKTQEPSMSASWDKRVIRDSHVSLKPLAKIMDSQSKLPLTQEVWMSVKKYLVGEKSAQ